MPPTATELSTDPAPAPAPAPVAAETYGGQTVPSAALSAVARAAALVADDLAATERRLRELLKSDIAEIPQVAGHVALCGGKRLRPLVALLAAQAAGYDAPHRITIAAVGELVHTATLLHDDVVDGGEFRRGRPAARMAYGNGLAVLTGNFCLCSGLVAIAESGQTHAYGTLAQTVMRMSEGEVAQLSSAGSVPSRARYYDIVDRKTAALIAWCASIGGLGDPKYTDALLRFGTELGYAFQIADDVLDVTPNLKLDGGAGPGVTGKECGQDLRDGKVTLPLALACEAEPALLRQVQEALAVGPPMAANVVSEILQAVASTDAAQSARATAQQHAASACEALLTLPPTPARDALSELAGYVVQREY
ncbi:MAG: polyprenyl synthetase family protein [Nannocystaceae bacterium]|nr:polyprenyl synthetase family protein [Nannocystaceae bacterium]